MQGAYAPRALVIIFISHRRSEISWVSSVHRPLHAAHMQPSLANRQRWTTAPLEAPVTPADLEALAFSYLTHFAQATRITATTPGWTLHHWKFEAGLQIVRCDKFCHTCNRSHASGITCRTLSLDRLRHTRESTLARGCRGDENKY